MVWAKHALVLCPSLPYHRQSASCLRYSVNSSSRVSLIATPKDYHRISCSGNLSFLLGPSPPTVVAGPRSFALAVVAFVASFLFGEAFFSFSFWGLAICFMAPGAHASSSSPIPASRTACSRSASVSRILPYFLQLFQYMSGVTAAISTPFRDCPVNCTQLFGS